MTICIAAAILEKTIVTLSDRQISLGDFAGDQAAEKSDFIHRNWTAMVAGDDITPAAPIFERMRKKLGYVGVGGEKPDDKTLTEVVEACVAAYSEQRQETVVAQFYAPHGLTEARFVSEGKKLLGLSLFTDVWNRVDRFSLQCGFLISGFDKNGQAHIFVVDNPGTYSNYGLLGFWALGSGQNEAISSIFFTLAHLEDFRQSLEGIVYDLCAAKFMAESNPHVGKAATIMVRRFNEEPEYYSDAAVETVRKLWQQGRPRRPIDTEKIIMSLKKGRITLNL